MNLGIIQWNLQYSGICGMVWYNDCDVYEDSCVL